MPSRVARVAAEAGSASSLSKRQRTGSRATVAATGSSSTSTSTTKPSLPLTKKVVKTETGQKSVRTAARILFGDQEGIGSGGPLDGSSRNSATRRSAVVSGGSSWATGHGLTSARPRNQVS